MAAVEVATRWGGAVRQIIALVHVGLISMLVIVVTEVLRLRARLVPAITRHGRPAELERQKGNQEDGEPTAHRKEFSGYRFEEVIWGSSVTPVTVRGFTNFRHGVNKPEPS